MKVIIAPLNNFLYHFDKYDGTSAAERFWNKLPTISKFINSKAGVYSILFPAGIFFALFYLLPQFIWQRFALRKRDTYEILNKIVGQVENAGFAKHGKNVVFALSRFKKQDFKMFIYYNKEMIPAKPKEREIFFTRLEKMKTTLDFKEVFYAQTKHDIENVLSKHEINSHESFFISDGIIELTDFKKLNKF